MNILLIHQYFLEPGDGGGSRFNEMARVWVEEGHQVEVLAGMVHYATGEKLPEYKGKRFVRRVQEGVDVLRCDVSDDYNTNFFGRLKGYLSFVGSSTQAGLTKLLRKPDVILVTSPPLFVGITSTILGLFKRTPFVFEVRDLWPESAIDTGVLTSKPLIKAAYAFERFIYWRANLVNVLTPAFRQKLIEVKGVPEDKVIFIPNAADFTLAEAVAEDFDRDAFRQNRGWTDKVVITYVGAHGVANHLDQILDTAALLRNDRPEVLFVLIGGGMRKAALKERAQRDGLDNVEFIDSVPKAEVFRYIIASDFGTSVLKRVETFKTIYSNKTFDYMACRVPVLLAIDGVSRELVEAADCGRFIEPEDPQDFKEVIEFYLGLPRAEWKRQGDSGHAYATEHFDRTKLALEYLTHLERVAAGE